MRAVAGTYRDGCIVLDEPVDWPEGCRVAVEAVDQSVGLRRGACGDLPEAALLGAW